MDWQSVGLCRDTLHQTLLDPNIPVSRHSRVHTFLYPNIPASQNSCIQALLYPTTAEDNTQKFKSIHATKFTFELFLCLTTACLSELAQFTNGNYSNKACSIIFPAQTEPSNSFSLNLLVTEFIFSSGGCDILKMLQFLFMYSRALTYWLRVRLSGTEEENLLKEAFQISFNQSVSFKVTTAGRML